MCFGCVFVNTIIEMNFRWDDDGRGLMRILRLSCFGGPKFILWYVLFLFVATKMCVPFLNTTIGSFRLLCWTSMRWDYSKISSNVDNEALIAVLVDGRNEITWFVCLRRGMIINMNVCSITCYIPWLYKAGEARIDD